MGFLLPTTPPANPSGLNYPVPTTLRLYRTITSASSGTQFYRVHEWSPPPWPSAYDDNALDEVVVNNLILISGSWANAPAHLDGLVAMPGG